jgi:hypothetical protein
MEKTLTNRITLSNEIVLGILFKKSKCQFEQIIGIGINLKNQVRKITMFLLQFMKKFIHSR